MTDTPQTDKKTRKTPKAKQAKAADINTEVQAETPAQQSPEKEQLFKAALGDVVLLLSQSPLHKYMFLTDIEATVMPALRSQQYRVFQTQGQTIALALWAQVSDEVHQRFMNGIVRLAPHEWSSGTHIWLMDIIAPPQKEDIIIKELKRSAFAGKSFMVQRFDEQGRSVPETMQGD